MSDASMKCCSECFEAPCDCFLANDRTLSDVKMALAAAEERAQRAEAALERVAKCLAAPNPGITDTIWLDPDGPSAGPTAYEFICGVLGREVTP